MGIIGTLPKIKSPKTVNLETDTNINWALGPVIVKKIVGDTYFSFSNTTYSRDVTLVLSYPLGTSIANLYFPTQDVTWLKGNSYCAINVGETILITFEREENGIVSYVTNDFIPLKMTTAQKLAIPNPANGMIVYDTEVESLSFYNSYTWVNTSGGNVVTQFYDKVTSSVQEELGSDSWPYAYGASISVITDGNTKTDLSVSNAVLDSISKVYRFPLGTEFLVSKNMLGSDFLASGSDVIFYRAEIYTNNGMTPALQLSRDGGSNYQSATIVREGLTNLYYSEGLFSSEPSDSYTQYVSSVLSDLGATVFSNSFSLANSAYISNITVSLSKTLSPTGYILLTVVNSLGNVVLSKNLDVGLLFSGINVVDFGSVLPAGNYTIKFLADSTYVSGYPLNKVTIYSNGLGIHGRVLDLRMKVTGSAGLLVEGLGVHFGSSSFPTLDKVSPPQDFSFAGEMNLNTFTITNFTIVPQLLKCYDATRGLVFGQKSFQSIDAQTVVFQNDLFLRPNEIVNLRFEQASGYQDSSDANAKAIASFIQAINNLNSSNPVGETKYLLENNAPWGFIPANGVSIGKTSGTYIGSEYYNLYVKLWGVSTMIAGDPYVISSSKGFDYLLDWDAGKTITIDESGLFTRAYKSGTSGNVGAKQLDQFQGHWHTSASQGSSGSIPAGSYSAIQSSQSQGNQSLIQNPVTDGTNGTPRTGFETRPSNIAKYVFIRYKLFSI